MAEVPPHAPFLNGYLEASLNWQDAFHRTLMQMQESQFHVFNEWTKSLCSAQQDLWDRWACRFGGGVPLDG